MPKITLDNYQQYLLRDGDGKSSTISTPKTIDELIAAKRTLDEPLQRNPLVRGSVAAVDALTSPLKIPTNVAKIIANATIKDDGKKQAILSDIEKSTPLSNMPIMREADTGGEKAADIIGSLLGNVALASLMGVGAGGGVTAAGTKAAGSVAAKTGSAAFLEP